MIWRTLTFLALVKILYPAKIFLWVPMYNCDLKLTIVYMISLKQKCHKSQIKMYILFKRYEIYGKIFRYFSTTLSTWLINEMVHNQNVCNTFSTTPSTWLINEMVHNQNVCNPFLVIWKIRDLKQIYGSCLLFINLCKTSFIVTKYTLLKCCTELPLNRSTACVAFSPLNGVVLVSMVNIHILAL